MHYDRLCATGPACTMYDALMYGEAAFKLKWDGSGGGYRMQQTGSIDPWNAAWTQNIGTPSGAMYAVSTGWRRDYTAGTVIVNPNAPTAGPITFNLGATYTDPNGNQVTSVTLQPVRAMILAKAGTPPPPAGTYYQVIAKHSGKCLDVSAASLVNGANVQQWACNSGANQRWKLVSMGDGYNQLVAKHSGKCLEVSGASVKNGANVQQWSCTGGDNQRWKLMSMGDGYNELVAKHSSKCAEVDAASLLNGANVQQWNCNGGNNQRWRLVAAG